MIFTQWSIFLDVHWKLVDQFFFIGQRLLHMEEYRHWEHMLGILSSTPSMTWSHILELDQEAY